MEEKQSTQSKKTTKKKVTKKAPAKDNAHPVGIGYGGFSQEELNKVSPGYIYELFDNTQCPSKISYDVKMLEKHCYELAMKLHYFYDTDDEGFRALVLETKKLFDKAVERRIELYKEQNN